MANPYPSAPTPAPMPTRGRTRAGLWIGVAVFLLAIGLVLGRWVFPAGTAATPAAGSSTPPAGNSELGAPHGPSTITKGVPSGYTRDETGAATAAANAVQLLVAVAHGQADPQTVQATWIASNAEQATRTAFSAGRNTTGDDQTTKLPASTRLTAFTDTAATVEVWVVSVGVGNAGTHSAARWTTVTLQLTWEDDWKVTRMQSVSGPQPGESRPGTSARSLPNSLYTFYIE